ncbi:MAG: MipA/OmpV family protein [Campylobacterota bacterium]|nr:MipA/OmpV family protein [Campylobacterota bacterium]
MFFRILVLAFLLFSSTLLLSKELHEEKEWGIAVVVRTATIPYATQDKSVSSFIPLLFYEDRNFFVNGLEAGVKLHETDRWRFSALTRMRFVDMPKEYQNLIQGDTADFGLQARYKVDGNQNVDVEFMRDADNYRHANLTYSLMFEKGSWETKPYATLRYKGADFNAHYYALEQESIGAGLDAAAGIKVKYHVTSNLYLVGAAQSRWLDANARNAKVVGDKREDEVSLGFGFFNDKTKKKRKLGISPYLRIAHGWATPSNLNAIITGDTEKDPYNNQLTSLFYGHPLTDELFGLPFDIYLTPGFVWHHSSEVQSSTQEYVLAIKAYYTFKLPVRFRFGFAEGLSYVNEITYIERTELEQKEYRPSKLLNYLDFSLDMHLGDIFGENLDKFWLGYSIHHRSAIFETASHFGRIKGGSNYNSVYLQWHF